MASDPAATSLDAPVAVVGGGIGGLTTALCLHASGIRATVYEQAADIRELGVGINVLPPAVGVLDDLGLSPELERVGVRTGRLLLCTRDGEVLKVDVRGRAGGHSHHQYSIHRGQLQGILHRAVIDRLGEEAVRTDHRLTTLRADAGSVDATFATGTGQPTSIRVPILVGADGIHSVVRSHLVPNEGPPSWTGAMIWRGATRWPAVDDGQTMIIAGGLDAKFVFYPIGPVDAKGHVLTNWAIVRRTHHSTDPIPARESWSRRKELHEIVGEARHFHLPQVDIAELMAATETIYEYPMCDRDPLKRWTVHGSTLLGDAAHPMYPVGSNGGTQAILDAACLSRAVASTDQPETALLAYEAERRPATAEIVVANRAGGPERIIDDHERATSTTLGIAGHDTPS